MNAEQATQLTALITATYTLLSIIVRLTPTQSDDRFKSRSIRLIGILFEATRKK